MEDNIEETLSFYTLPFGHHKHLKSNNMLERLNEEIKRRTLVVRIFPNEESCLRLIRALVVETHENWIEANRSLDMSLLTEMKKKALMELVASWKTQLATSDEFWVGPFSVASCLSLPVMPWKNLQNLTHTTPNPVWASSRFGSFSPDSSF